jgi:nucleolar protein 12
VFAGNLPFEADEEVVWRAFEKKNYILEKVRIIRDGKSQFGKGFAYITFKVIFF